MDRDRFDACTRLFVARRSRRDAIATLVGVAIVGHGYAAGNAKPGRNTSNGRRRGKGSRKRKGGHRIAHTEAVAANCFPGSSCRPGKGANLSGCDFGSTNALQNKNVSGANLGKVNLSGADASGANFAGANLGGVCLVDANLTEARINGSTNLGAAIFCRTTMPDGSINDSGCAKGTNCCPTCDAGHPCPADQICCNGRCRGGNCCTDAQCPDPAQSICLNFACAPCATNRQCGSGRVCCDGQCRTGNCCLASDCPEAPCQTRTCANNQCGLAPAANGTPCPDDTGVCCGGTCRLHQCNSGEDCPAEAPVCAGGTCLVASGCTEEIDRCTTGAAVTCPDNPNGLCIGVNGGQFCLSNGFCISPGLSCCDCDPLFGVCATINGPACCSGAGSQFCLPRASPP